MWDVYTHACSAKGGQQTKSGNTCWGLIEISTRRMSVIIRLFFFSCPSCFPETLPLCLSQSSTRCSCEFHPLVFPIHVQAGAAMQIQVAEFEFRGSCADHDKKQKAGLLYCSPNTHPYLELFFQFGQFPF